MNNEITGAEIVLKSLAEQGVEVVFGYPGGAVLPIYDTLSVSYTHLTLPTILRV